MSDYASILETTREAFASVARLERALMASPDDRSLQINLRSKRRLAERFQEQLFEAAQAQQVDVCQYRLIPNTQDRFAVAAVTKSIEKFQELFSLIYDALTSGPKMTAHISPKAAWQTELEFGYSYPGSLGVVLTVPSSRDLFSGKFDESIETLQQIFDVEDSHEVVDFARKLGKGVVNKAYDWSAENFKGDFSIDFMWRKSDGQFKGRLVDKQKIAHIVNVIGKTSEKSIDELNVRGVLVGVDVPSRWFHFVVPNGPSYTGQISKEFPLAEELVVNHLYRGKIIQTTVTQYATETARITHELSELEPIYDEPQKT